MKCQDRRRLYGTSKGMDIPTGGVVVLKLNYQDRRNNGHPNCNNGHPNCKGLPYGGHTVQVVKHDNAT